jgi:hypothetical protein
MKMLSKKTPATITTTTTTTTTNTHTHKPQNPTKTQKPPQKHLIDYRLYD